MDEGDRVSGEKRGDIGKERRRGDTIPISGNNCRKRGGEEVREGKVFELGIRMVIDVDGEEFLVFESEGNRKKRRTRRNSREVLGR